MNEAKRVVVDVRSALAAGQEPFPMIMEAVGSVAQPGDQLVLIAPFDPVPLYRVMKTKGYDHETTTREDGSYEVCFTRR